MENTAYDRIKDVIDYIEEHLHENLSLEDLADESGMSKFHLHKIFKYFTGEKLMDYVRLRKLSHSTNALICSDLKIIDIANEYNFDYEQSYIRAFKKTFQISPNKFRKERPSLPIKEKADMDFIIPVGENGLIFKPRIMHKPDMMLIGSPSILPINCEEEFEVARNVGKKFYTRISEVPHKKNREIFMALSRPYPEDKHHRLYIPCTEVRFLKEIPSGMKSYHVPDHRYAIFKQISLHHPAKFTDELKVLNDYIFQQWLEDSPYELADEYILERADLSAAHRNYGEYEILVPIKEKDDLKI